MLLGRPIDPCLFHISYGYHITRVEVSFCVLYYHGQFDSHYNQFSNENWEIRGFKDHLIRYTNLTKLQFIITLVCTTYK